MPSIIIMGSKSLVPAFSPSALALRLRSSNASEDSCSSNSSSLAADVAASYFFMQEKDAATVCKTISFQKYEGGPGPISPASLCFLDIKIRRSLIE